MKKNICLLIILVVCLLGITSVASLNVEEEKFVGKVNTNYLNLRQGPGTKFKIISVLKKNEIINIIGKIEEWYIVQTNENIIGVCNSKYVKKVDDLSNEEIALKKENEIRKSLKIVELNLDNKLNNVSKLLNTKERESITINEIKDSINMNKIEYMTLGYIYCVFNTLEEINQYVIDKDKQQYTSISNDYNSTGINIIKLDNNKYAFLQILIGK